MSLASIALDETMATSGLRQDAGSTRTSEQLGGYARTLLLSLTWFGKNRLKSESHSGPASAQALSSGGGVLLEECAVPISQNLDFSQRTPWTSGGPSAP
jgi:hypothetical protein